MREHLVPFAKNPVFLDDQTKKCVSVSVIGAIDNDRLCEIATKAGESWMLDGDAERGGCEEVPHVVRPDAKLTRAKSAGHHAIGRDGGGRCRRAIDARDLADPDTDLHGCWDACAAH